MVTTDAIRRLRLARLLLNQAVDHARVDHEAHSAACATSLQDAIEVALLALAETLSVAIPARSDFDKYFSLINEKIAPKTLPLHAQMMRLNKIRVQAKHSGIFPKHSEVANLVPVAGAFLEEICTAHLGVRFGALNLSTMIENVEQKAFVEEAELLLSTGNYLEAATAARKAFYLAFEKSADIRKFGEATATNNAFLEFASTSPLYARNPDYIAKRVDDAFAYIVLDPQRIDADLVRDAIDPIAFWNVWRLTPKVYLWDNGTWSVSRELSKTERDDLQADAIYVVETIADILLRREERRRRQRLVPFGRYWNLTMKAGAKVYAKADISSQLNHSCKAGEVLNVTAGTTGLDGSAGWWAVSHFADAPYFSGYVREEEVDRSAS